jgi:hypothetical protein
MPRGRPRKVAPVPTDEAVAENIEMKTDVEAVPEPIQKVVKAHKERKVRLPKLKALEVIQSPVASPSISFPAEDLETRIMKLLDERLKVHVPPPPPPQEPDDIILVKKKTKRQPPRKKVIYIEDDDKTIDDVVHMNHHDIVPTVQFW